MIFALARIEREAAPKTSFLRARTQMSVSGPGEETRKLLAAQAQVGPYNVEWFDLMRKMFLFYSSEGRLWCL